MVEDQELETNDNEIHPAIQARINHIESMKNVIQLTPTEEGQLLGMNRAERRWWLKKNKKRGKN